MSPLSASIDTCFFKVAIERASNATTKTLLSWYLTTAAVLKPAASVYPYLAPSVPRRLVSNRLALLATSRKPALVLV